MICLFVFLFSSIFTPLTVLADTSSSPVTIRAEVISTEPGGGGGDGDGGGVSTPVPGLSIENVSLRVTQTTAMVTWQVDGDAATECSLDVGLTTDYTATIHGSRVGDTYEAEITGLSADTPYHFRIRCTDPALRTATHTNSFETLPTDNQPPVIYAVSTNPDTTTAQTEWTATDDTVVEECTYVYDRDEPIAPYMYRGTIDLLGGDRYRASLSSLLPNTNYFFRITCVDAMPNSAVTLGEFHTDGDAVPPADAENFRANPRDRAIFLTWTYWSSVTDIDSFMIRRSRGHRPTSIDDGDLVAVVARDVREYLDIGLENGVEYFYTLFTFDTSDNHSNGVSVSAIPDVPGDRDLDGVTDDIDLCDLNNPEQIDTPLGTVVDAQNGCPRITVDMTDLTLRPQFLVTRLPGRLTVTIPTVRMRGATIFTTGLQAGTWYLDYRSDQVTFQVFPNGDIVWNSQFDNTFSTTHDDALGTTLVIQGYRIFIDSRGLDPRNSYRIYSPSQSSRYLTDIAEVHLYPKLYASMDNGVAPFRVMSDGSVVWDTIFDEFYSLGSSLAGVRDRWHIAAVGNQTLNVGAPPLCIEQDTLSGRYSLIARQGNTPFVSGDSIYYLLPLPINPRLPDFFIRYPYLQSEVSGERRNIDFLLDPPRLLDPLDDEIGDSIDLTMNVENIEVSFGICSAEDRVCGDSILEFTEQCDDGNTVNGDGCSHFCNLEAPSLCGNGIVDEGEECDDMNIDDHDGCSGICLLESPICGNIFIEGSETCDDGNTVGGDGCSALCETERIPVCGNNAIEIGEQCDDGNVLSKDGCSSACQSEAAPACSDGLDNDRDGLVDLDDPGCSGSSDTAEFNLVQPPLQPIPPTPPPTGEQPGPPPVEEPLQPPQPPYQPGETAGPLPSVSQPVEGVTGGGGPPSIAESQLSQLLFWIAERSIPVTPVDGTIISLAGDQLTIALRRDGPRSIREATLHVAGNVYYLQFAPEAGLFMVDIFMPGPGEYDAFVEVFEIDGRTETISFEARSLPRGYVRSNQDYFISGAEVVLYDEEENIWPASSYLQQNPDTTADDGSYGFVVPNGPYTLRIWREGFHPRTERIFVANNVVNQSTVLVRFSDGTIASLLEEYIDLTAQQIGDAAIVTQSFTQGLLALADNPRVEAMAQNVVAPMSVGGAIVLVIPSVSNNLVPLLRFLFLQPVLLFGRRKRGQWGTVFNSFTQLPLDLVTVRVVNAENNTVVQTRVTDFSGRYLFLADPGTYKVQATKNGFLFPTQLLQFTKTIDTFGDVYHGETIPVQETGAPLSPNIPLDPLVAEKKPWRIVWTRRLRLAQHVFVWLGLASVLFVFFIIPTIVTASYIVLHIGVYLLFTYLLKPRVPKRWGNIVDAVDRKPVGRAIIRLFMTQYDKLVATEVTTGNGRYAFLVGPGAYYLSVEKPGFMSYRSPDIHIKAAKESFVTVDVPLRPA